MSAIFIALLNQLNSSVFILMLILLVMFFGVYKIGGWKEKFYHHDVKFNEFSMLSKDVTELKVKVDLIYQNTHPKRLVESHSPISLTAFGETLAQRIKADTIMNKHESELVKAVEINSPRSAYDIQVQSMHVAKQELINILNESDLNVIKDEAYNNGLLVEDIFSIFGVLLRNKILKLKGIPIAHVDHPQS
jgi:hypothetical protein